MSKKLTQCDIILDMMKRGWVTPLDALREAGCFRLQARVFDLVTAGYEVERGWYEYESQYGSKKVRKYRIVEKKEEQGTLFE